MLKNKYFLISMLIIFILSIGFVSASNAIDSDLNDNALSDDVLNSVESSDVISSEQSVDSISNSADTENLDIAEDYILQSGDNEVLSSNIKPSGKTFNDIQKAVNNAKANDVIELDGTYTGSGKVITVKKSLTFNGTNGATLDAKKLSGIFYVPAIATLTFNNIKFTNAKGGAIYGDSHNYMDDTDVKLIINNCNFANNYNDYYAGAVYAPVVIATNSNFTGNYVKDPDGDGIGMSEGGAIFAINATLSNCNFNNNHAELYGGAIYCENKANISSCVFNQNYACDGGAISSVELYIEKSTFTSNYLKAPVTKVGDYGYPYHLKGGAINAFKIQASNCIFKNNSANINGGCGGAIYGTYIDVNNSSFEKNIANFAGAIYCQREIDEDDYKNGLLKINNCSFASNKEGAIKASKVIVTVGSSVKTYTNKVLGNDLKVMNLFKVTAKKLTTVYYSGKTIKIKVLTKPSSKAAKGLLLLVIAKSSKKRYSIPLTTNSKGIATLKASRLNKGYYKIYVYESF